MEAVTSAVLPLFDLFIFNTFTQKSNEIKIRYKMMEIYIKPFVLDCTIIRAELNCQMNVDLY